MAVTLADDVKELLLNALGDALDGGSLVFTTAGGTVVATITLNPDAFAAASGTGTVSIEAYTDPWLFDDDAVGNAAAITLCLFKTAAGVELFRVAVGTAAPAEAVLSAVILAAHSTLRITACAVSYGV